MKPPTRLLLPVLFGLLLALLAPAAARAQRVQSARFESIQIDLWPEYDRQAILVIYRVRLAADVELPVDLTFRIPSSAGEPNAVAIRPPESPPLNTAYERQVLGEWAFISLSATAQEVQLEYYDPGIQRDGIRREFTFQWPGDYAADSVVLLVQQPTGSENMATIPRLTAVTQDSFGLLYLGGDIGAVAAGEAFTLTITYEKQSDDLTVNFLPIASTQPLAENTAGRMSLNDALPWAMGLLGLAVIFVGVYWYWSTGRRQPRGKQRKPAKTRERARPRVLEPELQELPGEAGDRFCHQCGKRARAGDKFCRSCGTKLRS